MPSPPWTHAVLDEQALARLRELDPDGRHGVLRRVLATFESSLVLTQAQLREALTRSDAAAVRDLGHKLKSSSASVGALALSEHCARAERAVRSGEATNLDPLVDAVLAEADRVLLAVRAMLRG